MELWTAFMVGFLGSFHCIGMCGPLVLALPGTSGSTLRLVAEKILYNLGRTLTYTLLGILIGIVGHSIAIAGYQKLLSILLGISFIGAVVLRYGHVTGFSVFRKLAPFYRQLQDTIQRQFQRRGMSAMVSIGMLNGLLPCGFVYLGLAGAVTTGSIGKSALYMFLFGLGTLPAMLAVSLVPNFISLSTRQRITRLLPVFTLLLGFFLIYRGLMDGHAH